MTATLTARMLRRGSARLLLVVGVVLALFFVLFPFYWAFLNSIKDRSETFKGTWIPFLQFDPTLENWRSQLALPEIRHSLLNSLYISTGAATVAVVLGTLAGYGLARFRFRHPTNASLVTWFLSQRVLPPVIFLIPVFLLMRAFGMLDTVWALILLNATFTLPFSVIIMNQMFRDLPRDFEEAALVDGASFFQSFLTIALPLVAPGLAATWIISAAFSWNEFLFALSLTNVDAIPMPVIIAGAEHTQGVQFWFVGVQTLLTLTPPVILALLAQRYIVRGLTLGGVKG